MKRKRFQIERKDSPRNLGWALAHNLTPDMEHLIRMACWGREHLDHAAQDFIEALKAQLMNHTAQVLISPFQGVSDDEYAEAYQAVWERLGEEEDSSREPTLEEVEFELECMAEKRAENARAAEGEFYGDSGVA